MATTSVAALMRNSYLNRADMELYGELRTNNKSWMDSGMDFKEKELLTGDVCTRCFMVKALTGESGNCD